MSGIQSCKLALENFKASTVTVSGYFSCPYFGELQLQLFMSLTRSGCPKKNWISYG